MNKLIYTTAAILSLLVTEATTLTAFGQLSRPIPGMLAPAPLNFFRVALISKQTFNKTEGEAAMQFLSGLSDVYKSKLVQVPSGYKIAMMIRIIFFERKEADAACEFLKKNPMHEPEKYEIQVVEDCSY